MGDSPNSLDHDSMTKPVALDDGTFGHCRDSVRVEPTGNDISIHRRWSENEYDHES